MQARTKLCPTRTGKIVLQLLFTPGSLVHYAFLKRWSSLCKREIEREEPSHPRLFKLLLHLAHKVGKRELTRNFVSRLLTCPQAHERHQLYEDCVLSMLLLVLLFNQV